MDRTGWDPLSVLLGAAAVVLGVFIILLAGNRMPDFPPEENAPEESASAASGSELSVTADGYYAIGSAMSPRMLLRSKDASSEELAELELFDESSLENEIFLIEKQSDGFYAIRSARTGLSLDIRDGSAESGAVLQMRLYDATDGQKWKITETADGHVVIQSALGTVLDCTNGIPENGSRVVMAGRSDVLNQQWDLYLDGIWNDKNVLRPGTYAIAVPEAQDMVLTAQKRQTEDGSRFSLSANERSEMQLFRVELNEEGYNTIGMQDGQSFSVKDGSKVSGAHLFLKTFTAGPEQKWYLEKKTDSVLLRSEIGSFIGRRNGDQAILMMYPEDDAALAWVLLPLGLSTEELHIAAAPQL